MALAQTLLPLHLCKKQTFIDSTAYIKILRQESRRFFTAGPKNWLLYAPKDIPDILVPSTLNISKSKSPAYALISQAKATCLCSLSKTR